MQPFHRTITAAQLRTGHLLYTGGSGNYVAVAAATPNTHGQIQVWIYDGDNAIADGVRYTLEPESLVSVSAKVPMPVWLTPDEWEIVTEVLGREIGAVCDEESSACCEENPPSCDDHLALLKKAEDEFLLGEAVRRQIGHAAPGGAPGRPAR